MKFGKSLSIQMEETLPEWRDKFLSYKDLKKKVKLIDPISRPPGGPAADRSSKRLRLDSGVTREEVDFIRLLEGELDKFNAFFVEKEEEYIIRLKELQDRLAKAKDCYETIKIRKEIVDFHGEMVLLENYSALNYTGLVKILKKYEKRTGALIRLPFIQKVLQQPFFTTDLLFKLVKECETMLEGLFSTNEPSASAQAAVGAEVDCDPTTASTTTASTARHNGKHGEPKEELAEIEYMESLYMKSTISALRVLKEIRSRSSTVSVFSLPPLQISGLDDAWKKFPVLEQVAK